jgi:histidinol-phosphatase (PHP family)
MLKWDGHTHTRFCKHGSPAAQELYIEAALAQGFTRYTLSEHPPLPERWVEDENLMAELAMSMDELPAYFEYVESVKRKYEGIIEITAGLEVDYLAGAEAFSEAMLQPWAGVLEDIVVSVHYLPGTGGMRCIDFTPGDFTEGLLAAYGSVDAVVSEYYNHVEKAIAWASRLPGRVRLGHINLIEKFRTALPQMDEDLIRRRLAGIIPMLAAAGMGVDVNTAGLRVPTCGKTYVPEWMIRECTARGIPCVYGSDSHKPEHVGFGWEWYERAVSGQRG